MANFPLEARILFNKINLSQMLQPITVYHKLTNFTVGFTNHIRCCINRFEDSV